MKRMLFNATHPEELRVALVDGQRLYDLDIESANREQKKANIYKGRITRIEPSLEAAFIDYGSERHGFLPLKEVARDYFHPDADLSGKINIKDVLREGQELIVQVDKEERGTKGAALTTFISLAGRYLVLMPNNPRAGGVSRRIEGDDRSEARDVLSNLEIPDDMGIILRTAGVGKSAEECQWDLNYLLQLWAAIKDAADKHPAPQLIYQESNVVIRAIRDYLRSDIGELIIDEPRIYKMARDFMGLVMPQYVNKVKLYEETIPLFTRYQIESQIETAYLRQVRLPSGGSLIIDHTEALVSIDINSARATKGADIEETAFNTNLEAADEIARQLRLRDLGGLIVIDFIDMTPARHQREVENRLREALKMDRARVQVGRISRFGLLEMSRQRLRPSLGESSDNVCPRCNGHGTIRTVESLALSILRVIEEEACKESTGRIVAQLPVNVAAFLLNEKRPILNRIEERQRVSIVLIPNSTMQTPHYEVQRLRSDELPADEDSLPSYELATDHSEPVEIGDSPVARAAEPAVKLITPAAPPPEALAPAAATPAQPAPRESKPGLLRRLWKSLFDSDSVEAAEEAQSRSDGKGARGGNSKRGSSRADGESRRGSGKRGQRSDKASERPARGEKAERKETKEKESGRPPRAERPSKKPTRDEATDEVANERANAPESDASAASDDKGEGGSGRSRRGRRGGRRRRRSSGEGDNANEQAAQGNQEQPSAQEDGNSDSEGEEKTRGRRRSRRSEPETKAGDDASATVSEPKAAESAEPPASERPQRRPAEANTETSERAAEATAPKAERNEQPPAPAEKPPAEAEKPQTPQTVVEKPVTPPRDETPKAEKPPVEPREATAKAAPKADNAQEPAAPPAPAPRPQANEPDSPPASNGNTPKPAATEPPPAETEKRPTGAPSL